MAVVPTRICELVETLDRQIDTTDKQIDKLVYDLYGLTEEEIAIVEDAGK